VREAAETIRAVDPGLSILASDRGEVAERGLQGSIAAHRRAVQVVTALVALLAMLVSTHLDVSERRRELALLAAMGFSRQGLAALVVQRAALSAVAGGLAGVAAAVALAASRPEFLFAAVPGVAAIAVAVSVAAAVAAAAPVALAAAGRDPVEELQES
jgi:putative ABC transport system permease protein